MPVLYSVSARKNPAKPDDPAKYYAQAQASSEKLKEGQIVRLNDLGSFRIAIGSSGADAEDKFNAAMITKARIVFTPCKALKDMLKTLSYKKTALVATKAAGSTDDGGGDEELPLG